MSYILNGVPLSQFGFVPGRQSNSNLALSGFLNFPERIGDTFRDWADEDGIEPYVSADEIFFAGRDINLTGYIKGLDRSDCDSKRNSLYNLLDSFSDIVPLSSKWGSFQVYMSGAVKSDYLAPGLLSISIPMREPVPDLSGVVPAASGSEFGIDGISWATLGGASLELSGDRRNRPAPKADQFSVYGREGYAVTKTISPELVLRLYIKQPNYALYREKITGLYALLSSPGLRSLTFKNDKIRSFFVKDGFTVSTIYSKPDCFLGIVEMKLTQSGVPRSLTDLVDTLGNLITFNGNVIQVRI